MIGKWFYLFICLLPLASSYDSDRILFEAVERNSYSHRVLIRQTNNADTRIFTRQIQRPGRQPQLCLGPGRVRGRCVRLEDCVLREIHQDYVQNRDYFCVLRNQGGVGVCCPESITNPTTYHEGIFNQNPSSGSNRPATSSDDTIMFEQLQESTTSGSNRIPPPPNSGPLSNEITPLGDFLVCGRNGKKITRITTSARTTVKDWPWMAALVYRRTFKQFCGGTVITRRHVLTAAHCFPRPDPNEVVVLLGDYDLKRPDESKSKAFSVIQMIVHEDFDVTTYENDIAILVLNSTTIYNSFIQPCCLPPPGPRYLNTTGVVTGWGKLEFGGPSANLLMEVPVPVWEQARCASNFAQTIFDSAMCAGAYEGGKDACQGDSGGPLVMQRSDDRWAIIGIVSWGIRCGEKDRPGIYTRVNDHLEWIAQAIL